MENHGQRQEAEQQQAEEQKAIPNGGSDSRGDIETGQQKNAGSSDMENMKRVVNAIGKRDKDELENILSSNSEWEDLRDPDGRTLLHYAAVEGFHEGVCYLLGKCGSDTIESDNKGIHPLHLASEKGHVRVVCELMKYSSDPAKITNDYGQNILHIAAEKGWFKLVKYILKTPEHEKMINHRDKKGNTPLHLACRRCHPRIVHAFTWNRNVKINLHNKKERTALDAFEEKAAKVALQGNPPLSQQLTWTALKSAGARRNPNKISSQRTPGSKDQKASNFEEKLKDANDTIIVVATLIITATFAAGFTMPGGYSGSDSDIGTASMINQSMFYLFLLSITISMYGALCVTIILFLLRNGDPHLSLHALKVIMPLLGVTLVTLSLSFLSGVYLVISKLTWLGITFLVISAVFVLTVVLLCSLFFLPSSSTNPVMRYLSYFPFILLAKVAESERKDN